MVVAARQDLEAPHMLKVIILLILLDIHIFDFAWY